MLDFVAWVVVGSLLGWIASMVMGTEGGEGVLLNVVVGVVGAFLAGLILSPVVGVALVDENAFSVPALVLSLVGAVGLLALTNLFQRGAVR